MYKRLYYVSSSLKTFEPQKKLSTISYTQFDLVRKPSTLDDLIGYFTPSHVIHQRPLLQFLTAPEDGCK
jgi:hypothetical protein